MLRSGTVVGASAFVAAVACGGPSLVHESPAPASPRAAAESLPRKPMRLVASRGAEIRELFTIDDEGRIFRPGGTSARILDGRLVCDDGTELLRIDTTQRVWRTGEVIAHLTADRSFEVQPEFGMWSVRVRDDGTVTLTTRGEGTQVVDGLRWQELEPGRGAIAALLTAMRMPAFGGLWCGSTPDRSRARSR